MGTTKVKYNFDEKVLINALGVTWNAIAPDIFQSLEECDEGKDTMSAGEVIEVVLDSSYLEMYGFKSLSGRCTNKDYVEFDKLSYDERIKFCKEKVFTFKVYC